MNKFAQDLAPIIEGAKYVWEKRKRTALVALVACVMLNGLWTGYRYYNSTEYLRLSQIEEAKETNDEVTSELSDTVTRAISLRSENQWLEDCIAANSNTGTFVECSDIPRKNFDVQFKTIGTERTESVIPKAQAEEPIGPKNDNPFLSPSELFGPTKKSDKCYISQTENEHVIQKNGGMFATDIACNFGEGVGKRAEVYAPDLRDNSVMFRVEHVGHDSLLGSFVQLRVITDNAYQFRKWEEPNAGQLSDESFYLGHTETKFKEGDVIATGQRLGQMTLDGATTGWHVHVEYRRLGVDGKTWKSERYFTGARESALDNKRKGNLPTGYKWGDSFHFTGYDLGDPNQNDASPCHWADGTNMCDNAKRGEKQIALTVDVRNALGVKFGDKVKLVGKCTGEYVVRDEMNSRFRYACIKNESSSLCIKGDIALFEGKGHECSGPYKILQA